MKIAKGLAVLDVQMFNTSNYVHPVLLWDKENTVLIDTGYPGSLDSIKQAMKAVRVPFERLSQIILTHQDIDHIGSLASIIKNASQKIEIIAHTEEKPYIEFTKQPIKMTPEFFIRFRTLGEMLPEPKKSEVLESLDHLRADITKTVNDGDVLPYCGGIKVIYTPGHTPGHISLYLEKYKALVTGDAMNVSNGGLTGPNPQFTKDMELGRESLRKFLEFDVKTIISYHGGIYNNEPNQAIAALVKIN